MRVTYKNNEITNPLLRALIVLFVIPVAMFAVCVAMIAVVLVIVLLPIIIPLAIIGHALGIPGIHVTYKKK